MKLNLMLVVCRAKTNPNRRLEEATTLLKSAIILGKEPLHIHIFADEFMTPLLHEQVAEWATIEIQKSVLIEVHPLMFPANEEHFWSNTEKPCTCHRLFIPV